MTFTDALPLAGFAMSLLFRLKAACLVLHLRIGLRRHCRLTLWAAVASFLPSVDVIVETFTGHPTFLSVR